MLCIEQAKHTESENLKAIVRLVVEFFAKKNAYSLFFEIMNTSWFLPKTIRLLALNFYEAIINSGFALLQMLQPDWLRYE